MHDQSTKPPPVGGSALPGILIASVMLLGGLAYWGYRASTYDPIAARDAISMLPACVNAVQTVQAYKAPGQTQPLGDAVAVHLATESLRRPVAARGWSLSPASTGTKETLCIVHAEATIGNQPVAYTWDLWLDTGRVEAKDDATKRISGW